MPASLDRNQALVSVRHGCDLGSSGDRLSILSISSSSAAEASREEISSRSARVLLNGRNALADGCCGLEGIGISDSAILNFSRVSKMVCSSFTFEIWEVESSSIINSVMARMHVAVSSAEMASMASMAGYVVWSGNLPAI